MAARRHSPMLMLAAGLLSIGCSLLSRGGPQQLPTSEGLATAVPTEATVERSAAELLESAVAGMQAEILSIPGDALDPSDPAAAALVESYGVDADQVEIAAVSSEDSARAFQAGVIRVPGRDWAAVLQALADSQAMTFGVGYEWVEIGGRRILRAQYSEDPSAPPVHYAAAGDSLVYIQTNDEAAVESSVEGLPEEQSNEGAGGWQPPAPGTFPLMLVVMGQPQAPVCVGEPAGRQWLRVMAIDTGLGIPYPYTNFTVSGRLMEPPLQPNQFGPMATYPYAVQRYGSDGKEQVTVLAVSLMGGQGQAMLTFDVQHCLQGTWQDGERVVRIAPTFGSSVTAEVISGSICGEEGGVDFSGVLDGDQLTGDELKVCNPDECVEAGLLPASVTMPFTARVADDGQSVTFDWTGDFYQFEEDSQGNVVSCTKSSTEAHQFTITRLTFGE